MSQETASRWSPPTSHISAAMTPGATNPMCIQTGKTMSDPAHMHWTSDFYLKSRDEMMKLFGELEDAVIAVRHRQRCQVKLEQVRAASKFDVPAEHSTDTYFAHVAGRDSRSAARALKHARAGQLKHDLPTTSSARARDQMSSR